MNCAKRTFDSTAPRSKRPRPSPHATQADRTRLARGAAHPISRSVSGFLFHRIQ